MFPYGFQEFIIIIIVRKKELLPNKSYKYKYYEHEKTNVNFICLKINVSG